MAHPKNVQAILDWYRKNNKQDDANTFEALLAQSADRGKHSDIMKGMVALALQGFEAGREFERAHPDVESGIGYVPDVPPVREPSKPHPNLSDDINNAIAASEIEGGVWVVKPTGAAVKDDPFLQIGKGLLVTTRNTRYVIRKLGEEAFTIQGHQKYCPVATKCYIAGSTWGGSMLKCGWIGRGMHLEFSTPSHREAITTSQIQDVVEIP